MIKAILFDLDGTILDTVGDIRQALNNALGSSFSDKEVNTFVGNGLKNLVRFALESLKRPYTEDELNNYYSSLMTYYRQNPVVYTKPYPGVIKLLNTLNEKAIKIGIFSNKDQDLAETVINTCFKNQKIDFIAGRNGLYKAKPDPEAVFAFINKFNLKQDEVLYVGDSEVDYLCAKNANIKALILTWGTRTREFLLQNYVDSSALISSIEKILESI